MTKFRLEKIQLDTVKGAVTYEFESDLTVLAGPTGVGKTTLFELIKHGIGGDAHLSPVAEESVTDVHLTIHIGDRRLQLSRATASRNSTTVRVADLSRGMQLEDHGIKSDPRISDLLMTAFGLPTDVRAAAGGSSIRAGNRISFNDVFRFMYVSQRAMNRSIAGSDEAPLDLKRRVTFELMFGIVSREALDIRSELNTIKGEIIEATKRADAAREVLETSGTDSPQAAEIARNQAIEAEAQAKAIIETLDFELATSFDTRTQTLRTLLADAEREVTSMAATEALLMTSRRQLEQERKHLEHSKERLVRTTSASETIGLIEFVNCPRCSQSLKQRDVPHDACPVCLQTNPTSRAKTRPTEAEITRIDMQIEQLVEQLAIVKDQTAEVRDALLRREDLVTSLSKEIDERSEAVVTPRMRRYADAVGEREKARANQKHFEAVLRQWDRQKDIARVAEDLRRKQAEMTARLQELDDDATERREELVEMLNDTFAAVVRQFGIPTGSKAEINPTTYLPMINGRPFWKVSNAGGIITLTQLAYWLAVNTVALERERFRTDIHYPSFLLIDTPRLALGDQEELADRIYKRFQTDVASFNEGRAQIIVADNKPPREMDRRFRTITFDYDNPTVKGIAHPGPAAVEPIPSE